MDTNKMITYGIFTIDDKLTQWKKEHNRIIEWDKLCISQTFNTYTVRPVYWREWISWQLL